MGPAVGCQLRRRGAPDRKGAEGYEGDSDGISDVYAVTPREDEEHGIPPIRVEADKGRSERYRNDSESSDHRTANLADRAARTVRKCCNVRHQPAGMRSG